MARLNTSTALTVDTELAQLAESFHLEPSGPLEQWYYQNTGTWSPDRSTTPLVIVPVLTVYDEDLGHEFTPQWYSVKWYVRYLTYSVRLRKEVWIEEEVWTSDPSEDDYYLDGYNLVVQSNLKNDARGKHGEEIICEATYIDPRDSALVATVKDKLLLTLSIDGDIIYPEVQITSPSARGFNPLKDASSQFTFKASAHIGEKYMGWEGMISSPSDQAQHPMNFVKMNTLSWSYNSGIFTAPLPDVAAEPISDRYTTLVAGDDNEYVQDEELSEDMTFRVMNGSLQIKDSGCTTIAELLAALGDFPFFYMSDAYTGSLTFDEVASSTVQFFWCVNTGDGSSGGAAEISPCYVSGQGTDTLVVDAMYGNTITVNLMCSYTLAIQGSNAWSEVSPSVVYATVAWQLPKLDCQVLGENGKAVRSDTESMAFSTIINTAGIVLDDAVKNDHLRFNWKSHVQGSNNNLSDRGWGCGIDVPGSALRVIQGGAQGTTHVNYVTYLMGAYEKLTYNGEVVTDSDGVTPIYGRTID